MTKSTPYTIHTRHRRMGCGGACWADVAVTLAVMRISLQHGPREPRAQGRCRGAAYRSRGAPPVGPKVREKLRAALGPGWHSPPLEALEARCRPRRLGC